MEYVSFCTSIEYPIRSLILLLKLIHIKIKNNETNKKDKTKLSIVFIIVNL